MVRARRWMQVKHEQSKNSFSKEHKRIWEAKCAPEIAGRASSLFLDVRISMI